MTQPVARKDSSASKAWLRALELTARSKTSPTRIFPVVVEELGARFGDAPALIGPQRKFQPCRAGGARQPIRALGAGAGHRERRHGLPADAQSPGLSGDLAGHHPHRRHCGADEHQSEGRSAGPLHPRWPRPSTSSPPKAWPTASPAAPGSGGMAPAFRQLLESFSGAPLERIGTARGHAERPRPADLHLRHHRPAQGGPCQPSPGDELDPLVRRHDRRGPDDRLYNCLPMYHSVGGVVASGAVLVGGGAVILREKFSASAFWRDVADSGATIFQYIGELCRYLLAGQGEVPAHNLRLAGQRPVGRCVGSLPGALRHSADPGILCRHRRQFLALQCRRQARRHRPHSAASWRTVSRPPS